MDRSFLESLVVLAFMGLALVMLCGAPFGKSAKWSQAYITWVLLLAPRALYWAIKTLYREFWGSNKKKKKKQKQKS